MPANIAIHLPLPPELYAQLQNAADLSQQSVEEVILEALEYFTAYKMKREAWGKEGRDAWNDFQKTGLHLTNGEVQTWMKQIMDGKDVPLPKCHM